MSVGTEIFRVRRIAVSVNDIGLIVVRLDNVGLQSDTRLSVNEARQLGRGLLALADTVETDDPLS